MNEKNAKCGENAILQKLAPAIQGYGAMESKRAQFENTHFQCEGAITLFYLLTLRSIGIFYFIFYFI